jgi:hypothetical protein
MAVSESVAPSRSQSNGPGWRLVVMFAAALIVGLGAGFAIGSVAKSQSRPSSALAPAIPVSNAGATVTSPRVDLSLPALLAQQRSANSVARTSSPSETTSTSAVPPVATPQTSPSPSSSGLQSQQSRETIHTETGGGR